MVAFSEGRESCVVLKRAQETRSFSNGPEVLFGAAGLVKNCIQRPFFSLRVAAHRGRIGGVSVACVCVCVYCNNNTRRGRLPPAGQINVNSILRDRARPNSFAVPHLVVGEASRANNTAVRRAYRVTH